MLTLGDIPRKGRRIQGRNEAVIFAETRLTYRQFDDRVNALANVFLGLGCRCGHRLAVLSDNSHRYLETYFAAAKAGLVVLPLNVRLADHEMIEILRDAEPFLLLLGEGYEAKMAVVTNAVHGLVNFIAMDNPIDGCLDYERLIAESSTADPRVPVGEDDLAVLMYTGGTTGVPKGVMLTHRNIMASAAGIATLCRFSHHDTTCLILPLFHVAFWPALCCLLVGGRVVILRRAIPELVLEAIQKEGCTHLNAVPTLYSWILELPHLGTFDLSSLRLMTYAGSPMPVELLKRCIGKFGPIFAQGYGMTEAAPLISFLLPEDHAIEGDKAKLLTSAGKAGPGVEIRIVDERDTVLGPCEVGEVTIRGANVMRGYWRNEGLTREWLRDGWLRTGDMGCLDQDGYLYLSDRKADMIITGGENVYPTETENIIFQHPAVLACAVVGIPDEHWGERVVAAVVCKPELQVDERELIDFCRARLAHYKCPKGIVFLDKLPLSAVGKVLRKEVKKCFFEQHYQ